MRPLLVVDLAKQVQRGLQLRFGRDIADSQDLLERGPDPFDAAIHPRAVGLRPLVADTQPLQREGEDPRGEHGFVVRANRLRLAVVFDGVQQQAQDGDGGALAKRVQRQHASAAVVENSEQRLSRPRFDPVLGEIDGPDLIDRAGGIDGMRMALGRCPPLPEVAQELRHVGLADRPALFDMVAIEPIRDHAATGVGSFERNSEQRFAHRGWFRTVVTHVAGLRRYRLRFTFGLPARFRSLRGRWATDDTNDPSGKKHAQLCKYHLIQPWWFDGRSRSGRAAYARLRYNIGIGLGHFPLV